MTAKKFIEEFIKPYLGYKEGPNNDTIFGTWYGLPNQPWCMMFLMHRFNEAGIKLPHVSASCSDMRIWYMNHRPTMVHNKTEPKVGDIMILNGHTGIVYQIINDYWFYTIEGNYSDKVTIVKRCTNEVMCFIRPDYEEEVKELVYHHIDEIPNWGINAVRWALDNGILNGVDYQDLGLTLSELKCVVMLFRFNNLNNN